MAALPRVERSSGVALVGTPGRVAGRVAAFGEAGVNTLNVAPMAKTHERRVRDVAQLKECAQ